jgi:hypothetical protein
MLSPFRIHLERSTLVEYLIMGLRQQADLFTILNLNHPPNGYVCGNANRYRILNAGVLKITTLGFQSSSCNSIGIVEHSLNIFQSTVSSFLKCTDIEIGSIHDQVGD